MQGACHFFIWEQVELMGKRGPPAAGGDGFEVALEGATLVPAFREFTAAPLLDRSQSLGIMEILDDVMEMEMESIIMELSLEELEMESIIMELSFMEL
jgi:hypothetical protein